MNPFEWSGPYFLGSYIAALVAAWVIAPYINWWLRAPLDVPEETPALPPYQTAYLAGGPWRAFASALGRLINVGALADQGGHIVRSGPLPEGARALDRRLWDNAVEPIGVRDLFARCDPALEALAQGLRERGLLLGTMASWGAAAVPALLLAGLTAAGVWKVIIGLSLDRPVTFLIIATVLAAAAALSYLFSRTMRTGRGDGVIEGLLRKHDALGATARSNPALVPAADIALAVALFGTCALATPAFAGIHPHLAPAENDNGGGCGGGGCGGGGCGGGGCGGGCGGCGG